MIARLKEFMPYVLGFIIVSSMIFYPELQGKKLSAHDAVSWFESSKEWKDYQDKGESIYWTNRIFSGMPLFTVASDLSGNFFMIYFSKFMYSLPNNWAHLIAVFLCCFISLIFLKIDKRLAFILSIAFGLNTWILDSLWASHPTKILSLAYLFPVIAGLIGFMKYDRWLGLVFIMLGLTISIGYGHYQIIYYGVIINVILVLYFLYDSVIHKTLSAFVKKIGVLVLAVGIASATHLSSLLVINDYNKETMRGGKTELVKSEANSTSKDGGLDIDYAFSWSYCWPELMNFLVPDAMGGSSNYLLKTSKSEMAAMFHQDKDVGATPVYWGIQPFTGAPNYLGAGIIFLLIFSMWYWQNTMKYVFLALLVLSMFMGLGKSFLGFNEILFNNLPLYNKFRTPTMAFSILNLISILTIGFAFNSFLSSDLDIKRLIKTLKNSAFTIVGLLILGFILISNEGYSSIQDEKMFQGSQQALNVATTERASLFKSDMFRSILIILLSIGAIYLYIKSTIKQQTLIIILGFIIFFDLYTVYRRYLDYDVFQKVKNTEDLIPNEPYNQFLEQDKSYFRMINYANQSVWNSNSDGYRFNNVGGYSPAKLYRYQDLIDVHLGKGNQAVLNMLNTKYIVVENQGQLIPQQNPNACGNAWFVSKVNFAKNANEEMDSIGTFDPKLTAWVDQRYKNETKYDGNTDPNARIELIKYHPENLEYKSSSTSGGFATFSEIWYKGNEDWKVYIDGKESKMIRTDYLLRGTYIPAGNHKIEMKFNVAKVHMYKNICMALTAIMLLLCGYILYREYKLRPIEEV